MLFVAIDDPTDLLDQAGKLLKEGDAEQARALLARVPLERLSRQEIPRYHATAGVLAQQAGEISEAVRHHREAVALALELGLPRARAYAANLAGALYRLRDREEARPHRDLLARVAETFRGDRSPGALAGDFVVAAGLAYLGEAPGPAYELLAELSRGKEPPSLIAAWGFLALAEHHVRAPATYDDLMLAFRWSGVAIEVGHEAGLGPAQAAGLEVHYLAAASVEELSASLPELVQALYREGRELFRLTAVQAAEEHLLGEERRRALARLGAGEAPPSPRA